MSEHVSLPTGTHEPVTLEAGLEALESSSEFHGPVEALDGHHCNDHFAQIYERDDERFTASVPFVRHGLEGDERVMYVIDKSSESEVHAALHDGEIDVDAALDAGQLSFHTIQDTYLRNGTFEPDEMIEFYGDTVKAATEEYEALRIVAETTWLQHEATTVEQFMEYESKINDLFADEDCFALCQYDRNGFSPEIVRNIVQTHPHLIYDGAVCHNFYYTPPAEFFGPDKPARENDRMLQTLRERTVAKTELQQKNERLESFASMLAHELRNPTMIGQIYSQQLPDETDSEAVEYVIEAFDRIENMVDVMLMLTRGSEAVDERTSVELADVAEQVWADVDAPDAAFAIEVDDTIEADETYIHHLFRNLFENAVEHGGAGVTVTVGKLDDGFYVADDGTGIPPQKRTEIFDEGYTTAADNGGAGLGLAFVQKLAEVYDWDCAVTESEAGGARFEFRNIT